MEILGVDIGGTGVKGAPVDSDSAEMCAERYRVLTPRPGTPEAVARSVVKLARHFDYHGPIGVGFPGPVKRDIVLNTTHLDRSWIGRNAHEIFAEATGCPVTVLNDADGAGIAEMRFGAGREHAGVVLLVTFGTGIGTALFVDGRLVPNTEFGHVEFRGKDAEYHAAARIRTERNLSWKAWGRRVNEYLAYLEYLLAPDLIIVGGGVSKNHKKFLAELRLRAPVVPAQFRNNAGLVGAALGAAAAAQQASAGAG